MAYTYTRTLELIRFALQQRISRSSIRDAVFFDVALEHISGDIVIRLERSVVSEQAGRTSVSFESSHAEPLTWWDHFKAEHPRLCARLEPPRYKHTKFSKSIPVEARMLFPDYAPPYGLGRSQWQIRVMESER
jgi:hypothetical protein